MFSVLSVDRMYATETLTFVHKHCSFMFPSSVCPHTDTDQLYNTQQILRALSQVTSLASFQKQVQSCCHLVLIHAFLLCSLFFNLRRAQDANLVLHHSCSDAIILYDNMLANALDKVVIFAGEVLFERKPLTLSRRQRQNGQPEELHTPNEYEAIVHFISSLMKQVLKFPNTPTIINDSINHYSQTNPAKVDYYPESHRDSEIHATTTGTT